MRLLFALSLALALLARGACAAQTAQAARGDIVKTVFGSGTVRAASQPAVTARADGTVGEVLVSPGDIVEAGDSLVKIYNAELANEAERLALELADAQDAAFADASAATQEPLAIAAPGAGRVMAVYVAHGDDALAAYREHGAVAILSTDGRMKIELSNVAATLSLGDRVRVIGEGFEAEGTVVLLARRGTEATVQIAGDTYPMGASVAVCAPDGTLAGHGALEVNKPLAVSAWGGTIRDVLVRTGQTVERGQTIARFVWDETPLALADASALLDYAKAKTALEEAREDLSLLEAVAPCAGTVAAVEVKEGDEVRAGQTLARIVEDGAGMEVVLKVDELDILRVEPGQTVTLTADALPDAPFAGTVEKIAPLGDTSQGVTTYDVYVAADGLDARILSGMNVSGEIAAKSERDALLVPTDALKKDADGYFVTLPSGEARRVTLGLVTDDKAQILSGLTEGEQIEY